MIKRTLYFGNPAYLSLQNSQLLIRLPEVEKNNTLSESFKKTSVKTIPIEDIGVVMLDNKQITITQGLLEELVANNAAVITCDKTHHPTGLLMPLVGNKTQTEKFRDQINASLPLKKQLWAQTISVKINNQAAVLSEQGAPVENMLYWAGSVKSGDPDNYEGRAAAYYWGNVFGPGVHFLRGQNEAPPNNLLNYGYAILRAVVARSLVSSGLLPTLGIFHRNKYNAFCLADDIMEPYRPYVDKVVIDIVNSGVDFTELTMEVKQKLLSIPVIDVKINRERSPLMVGVQRTTASLARCFSGEARKLSLPEIN